VASGSEELEPEGDMGDEGEFRQERMGRIDLRTSVTNSRTLIHLPLVMNKVYQNKRSTSLDYSSAADLFLTLFVFMRYQTCVCDKQF
jgi:hypothetical protein